MAAASYVVAKVPLPGHPRGAERVMLGAIALFAITIGRASSDHPVWCPNSISEPIFLGQKPTLKASWLFSSLLSCFTSTSSCQKVLKMLLLLFHFIAVCAMPLWGYFIKAKQQIHHPNR